MGGPGDHFDQIWSFTPPMDLRIIGQDDEWWLVEFDDDRTRHEKCWIHRDKGSASGDLASVEYSDYRTEK